MHTCKTPAIHRSDVLLMWHEGEKIIHREIRRGQNRCMILHPGRNLSSGLNWCPDTSLIASLGCNRQPQPASDRFIHSFYLPLWAFYFWILKYNRNKSEHFTSLLNTQCIVVCIAFLSFCAVNCSYVCMMTTWEAWIPQIFH